MSNDPKLQGQVYEALNNFLRAEEPALMNEANKFLLEFKQKNELLFIQVLIPILGNDQESNQNRRLAAIFIFKALKKRTLEDQKIFISEWYRVNFEMRETLRQYAFNGLISGSDEFANECSYLLGQILAIEFNTPNNREFAESQEHFHNCVSQLLDFAGNSPNPAYRFYGYTAIMYFAQYSLDLSQNCSHDAPFLKLVPDLFNCILAGMVNAETPIVQESASNAMMSALLIFKRHLSFPQNRNNLFEVLFRYLDSDDTISQGKTYFGVGYAIIRRIIDLYYPYIEVYIDTLFERTLVDLQSDNADRQIEASLLWRAIGEVESDIQFPERRTPKNKHHEFDQCLGFSHQAFPRLFEPLVTLIQSTGEEDTDANTSLDRNPQHAAFTCLSELSSAADNDSLDLMFSYVMSNIEEEQWTLRYTSVLLLNAASQLDSFESDIDNILTTFKYFVKALDDSIPRIIEVAMWSLGRMIDRIPELVTDPERFVAITSAIAQKLEISEALTSRAGWLFNKIFNVFSPGEGDSLIATNFGQFSELLLNAADIYKAVDPLDAAYGALNKLIEKTPSDIVQPYADFLQLVINRLALLIQSASTGEQLLPYNLHKMLGLCSFVEAIVMNIGTLISDSAPSLVDLLLCALPISNGDLVCVVLPALGAVARAIGANFVPYLENLLPKLEFFLQEQSYAYYAAVFVCDIYNAIPDFPSGVTDQFVSLLFGAFDIPEISNDTRVAIFYALTEIVKQIGPNCFPWVEQFLKLFEKESRSALVENENTDETYVKSFSCAILQCYQTIAPLFANVDRGDRKVRNFFHIYDKLVKIENMIDEEVIMEAVILVKLISDLFGRRITAYTHKPMVLKIIGIAKESENQTLQEAAIMAEASIQAC